MRGVKSGRNRWTLFLFLLAGMVLGAFLGYTLREYDGFAWLDYGQTFGLTNPVTLSLGVISLTVGFVLKINIGSIIGMLLGYLAYRFAER
jgi:uncharacterized membrane protein YfcA